MKVRRGEILAEGWRDCSSKGVRHSCGHGARGVELLLLEGPTYSLALGYCRAEDSGKCFNILLPPSRSQSPLSRLAGVLPMARDEVHPVSRIQQPPP